MRIAFLTGLLFCFVFVSGQDRYIVAGDRLMERLDFLDALEKYQISYIYKEDYIASKRIARAYLAMQRLDESATWMKKLFSYAESTNDDRLEYAKILVNLDRIEEAEEQLELFRKVDPDDKRAQKLGYLVGFIKNKQLDPIKGKDRSVDYCIHLKAVDDITQLGPDVKIEWLFDDGTLKRGNEIDHCFKTAGKHSVTLSSIDKTFDVYTRQDTVMPLFFLEEVNFSIEGIGWVDAAVQFDARKLAYRKNILGVVWQTGDGNVFFDEVFTHKYLLKGNYTVTLTVIAEDSGNIYPGGSITRSWNVIKR
ncbi:MAG: PKD domain-containing protein [Bacteroidota bacterium]